ncbi:MAG TPA: zf-HC2 domain-containing protein [Rubrobacteraceae bacterium]|nr:zf-HC2 domain-containing protein [Rubrobacteraceae bacterium]
MSVEELLPAYAAGELSEMESERVEVALAESQRLRVELSRYERLFVLLSAAAAEEVRVPGRAAEMRNFVAHHERVSQCGGGSVGRYFRSLRKGSRLLSEVGLSVGEVTVNDLIEAFVVYVPKIVEAFALLVPGFALAVAVSRVTPFLLRRVRFDQVCARAGVTNLMREGGISRTPTQLASMLVFYAV